MADEPENLVLEHLRHIRGVVDATREDLRDVKVRLTNLEEAEGRTQMAIAGVNRRLDRLDERVDRIEQRLELTDA